VQWGELECSAGIGLVRLQNREGSVSRSDGRRSEPIFTGGPGVVIVSRKGADTWESWMDEMGMDGERGDVGRAPNGRPRNSRASEVG